MLPKIRSCVLDLLALREHSKFELQRKLIAKGFAIDDVHKVLQDLERQGLQSDARFAESYIAMRRKRGFGPIRIKAELCERGVDKELGENFLAEYKSTWGEQVEVVRCKKFGKKNPRDLHEQAKQIRYLYYKGFDPSMIKGLFS